MASNYTGNYNLNQWAASDRVLRTEFNADNAKIDAAIKAVDGRIDSLTSTVNGKVSTSTFNSLKSTVDGLKTSKADKTALESLKTTVTQHTTALAAKGNCQVYTTSYTGTGGCNVDAPTSLTFPKKPMAVFVFSGPDRLILFQGNGRGWSETYTGRLADVTVTWSGNTVRWYTGNPSGQMNFNNLTYSVIALLQTD